MNRLLFAVAALTATVASAQNPTFFPMKQGAMLEYAIKDGRGRTLRDAWRNERWMRLTVEQVWGDTLANVRIANQELERLGKIEQMQSIVADLQYGDVLATKAGITTDNIQWHFSPLPEMFENVVGSRHLGESTFRPMLSATSHLPREMKVGDVLPNEEVRIVFDQVMSREQQAEQAKMADEFNQQAQMHGYGSLNIPQQFDFTITGSITDRNVAGFERVVAPAGEFECWKIAYNIVGPKQGIAGMPEFGRGGSMGGGGFSAVPLVTPCVDYVSPIVGLVRRETWSDNGKKIVEVMELTKVVGGE